MIGLARAVVLAGLVCVVVACGWTSPHAASVGVITFEVSGGFTGWDRTVIVDPDGTAHLKVDRGPSPPVAPTQVDAATLARLHALVADPAFASLAHAYLPPPGGADLQDYTITAEVDGRQVLTMTRDGASPPAILRDVLGILNGILVTFGSQAAADCSRNLHAKVCSIAV
jgi:hypothetical protein